MAVPGSSTRARARLGSWLLAAACLLGMQGCAGEQRVRPTPALRPAPVTRAPASEPPEPVAVTTAVPVRPPAPVVPAPQLPTLPNVRRGKHAGGARYAVAERSGELATAVLQIDVGALDGPTGVAQLTAATVALGGGSKAVDADPLAAQQALAQFGGQLEVTVGSAHTRFALQLPARELAAGLIQLTSLFGRPTLAGQLFGGARDQQLTRLRLAAARGEHDLMRGLLRRLLLGGGDSALAARAAGTASELEDVTLASCDAFYQARYSAERVSLAVVGPSLAQAEAAAQLALARLRQAPAAVAAEPPLVAEDMSQRAFVVDVPSRERSQLWSVRLIRSTERAWPSGALAQAQLATDARTQLRSVAGARLEQAGLMSWGAAGALWLRAEVPRGSEKDGARALQLAMIQLASAPDAGTLSSLRAQLTLDLSARLASGLGTANWLLDAGLGYQPRDRAQLTALLQAPAAPWPQRPSLLLAVGPAAELAPALTSFGEVLILDPQHELAVVRALLPDFEVVHADPPEPQAP